MIKHHYFKTDDVTYTVHHGEDMGRPSILHIHAAINDGEWTIEVGGNCYIVASGEWE